MELQSVTVQLPAGLYNRLKRRAEKAQRSIETEMVETVADALPADEVLSAELSATVAQLATADDETLLRTAKAQFPPQKSAQLEALHLRRQESAWSEAESRQADELSAELEQFIFLRAQAMSFLLQRGYDVAALISE
jgi:plasmid stability protein